MIWHLLNVLQKKTVIQQSVNGVTQIYHGFTNGSKTINCGEYENVIAVATAIAEQGNSGQASIDSLTLTTNGTVSKIINGARYDDDLRPVAKTFIYYIKKGTSIITVTANNSGGMGLYELTILGIK